LIGRPQAMSQKRDVENPDLEGRVGFCVATVGRGRDESLGKTAADSRGD
jgi:hypothetical protein